MSKTLDDTNEGLLINEDNMILESKVFHMCCKKQKEKCIDELEEKYVSKLDLSKQMNKFLVWVITAIFLNVASVVAATVFMVNLYHKVNEPSITVNLKQINDNLQRYIAIQSEQQDCTGEPNGYKR